MQERMQERNTAPFREQPITAEREYIQYEKWKSHIFIVLVSCF